MRTSSPWRLRAVRCIAMAAVLVSLLGCTGEQSPRSQSNEADAYRAVLEAMASRRATAEFKRVHPRFVDAGSPITDGSVYMLDEAGSIASAVDSLDDFELCRVEHNGLCESAYPFLSLSLLREVGDGRYAVWVNATSGVDGYYALFFEFALAFGQEGWTVESVTDVGSEN